MTLGYSREVSEARTDPAAALLAWANRPPQSPHIPGLMDALRDLGYHHAHARDVITYNVLAMPVAHRSELISVERVSAPTEPLVLYRGAPASRAVGASWTPQLPVARMHAYDWQGAGLWGHGKVFQLTIPADRILQRLTLHQTGGWHFDEYIADATGLTPEVLPATGRPHAALVAEVREANRSAE